MQRDKITVLVMFLLVIAAAVGLRLVGGQEIAGTQDNGAAVSVVSAAAGEFRGVALQMHNPGDENHPYEQFIDEIAETGANTVYLVVAGYQENCSSSSVFIEQRKSPSHDRIRQVIRHARKRGLRVGFMPVILLENPRPGEWRGKIMPDDFSRWWEKYSEFVMHYAYLCMEMRVELFMIGSELNYLENRTREWRRLIKRVRKSYDGLVSYSANWDHYRVPKFWEDLDMVGMTTYHDLTGGKEPTLDRLRDSWDSIKKEILDWQQKVNKPILFTEVGWPNQPTCAQYPWNYYQTEKTDPKAQANCYEAFFSSWFNEKAVAGFVVWEWRKSLKDDCEPNSDNSYVPYKKPALDVVSKYFQMPSPWQTQAPKEAKTDQPNKDATGS